MGEGSLGALWGLKGPWGFSKHFRGHPWAKGRGRGRLGMPAPAYGNKFKTMVASRKQSTLDCNNHDAGCKYFLRLEPAWPGDQLRWTTCKANVASADQAPSPNSPSD